MSSRPLIRLPSPVTGLESSHPVPGKCVCDCLLQNRCGKMLPECGCNGPLVRSPAFRRNTRCRLKAGLRTRTLCSCKKISAESASWRKPPMARKTRWWLLGFALLLLGMGCFVVRPAFHLAKTWWNDKDEVTPPAVGHVDDASRLNETRVAQVWDIPADRTAAEQQLRDLLQWARTRGLRVAIAGARHSMGGHTIYPDGIVLNMLPFNHINLDTRTGILHVGAGARWSEVLPYLETHGCSVAVMQSNNSFSVGG